MTKLDDDNALDRSIKTMLHGPGNKPVPNWGEPCELCGSHVAAPAHLDGVAIQMCEQCAKDVGASHPFKSQMQLGALGTISEAEFVEQLRVGRDGKTDGLVKTICYSCRDWVEIKPSEMYRMKSYPLCEKCKNRSPRPSPKVIKK